MFTVENFFSHTAGKFRKVTTLGFRNFLVSKDFMQKRGSRFRVGIFLSHSTKKFRRRALLCQKGSGLKKLHKVVHHDFVENWFSHSTENFRRRILHFSKKFFYRKFLRISRGYHDSLSKVFCLTLPKKFLVGHFCSRKFLDWKNCIRWCITILSKIEFLTVPKNFLGEPSIFQKHSFVEKNYG